MKTEPTRSFTIYIAGDVTDAKRKLRELAYQHGLCVTVTPADFIYTGGEETGVAIGLVNYPRFPSTFDDLQTRAISIAQQLIVALCQKTALVVGPAETHWIVIDPPGMR